MRPGAYIQSVLATSLDCRVFSQVPRTVAAEFVLHTVVTNTAVANGEITDSMDVTVAFSIVAGSNDRAWEIAHQVTRILSDAYEGGSIIHDTGLSYMEAVSLPVKQPAVDAVTAPGSHEYDSVFRIIFV